MALANTKGRVIQTATHVTMSNPPSKHVAYDKTGKVKTGRK